MNKTQDQLIQYLLNYVEQSVEYPEIVLDTIASKINAKVTRCSSDNYSDVYSVNKKGEVLFSGYFRDVLEYLVLYILENLTS